MRPANTMVLLLTIVLSGCHTPAPSELHREPCPTNYAVGWLYLETPKYCRFLHYSSCGSTRAYKTLKECETASGVESLHALTKVSDTECKILELPSSTPTTAPPCKKLRLKAGDRCPIGTEFCYLKKGGTDGAGWEYLVCKPVALKCSSEAR